MATSLKLVLPDSAPDRYARTSILDQDLAIIHQNAPGILQPGVQLEPGIYAARTVLTDGTQFQAAFEVNEGDTEIEVKLKNITAARARMAALSSVTEDAPPLEEVLEARSDGSNMIVMDSDNRIVLENYDAGSEPDEILSMSLSVVAANGQVQDGKPLPDLHSDVVLIEPGEYGRFLQVGSAAGRPDRFIAVPTSASEGAEIHIPSGDPTTFTVKLGDERADLLLHYLEGGHIGQASEIIADHWPTVEALLSLGSRSFSEFSNLVTKHLPQIDALAGEGSTRLGGLAKLLVNSETRQAITGGLRAVGEILWLVFKYQPQVEALVAVRRANPITATVAAYAVLLVGPPMAKDGKPTHVSELMNLCADFLFAGTEKSSDELCICAELFARQGKHEEALNLLLELPKRAAPMFTYGLRFALDRLNAYRNAAVAGKLNKYVPEIEAALEQLAPLACRADFSRAILTFEAVPEMAEPHVLVVE